MLCVIGGAQRAAGSERCGGAGGAARRESVNSVRCSARRRLQPVQCVFPCADYEFRREPPQHSTFAFSPPPKRARRIRVTGVSVRVVVVVVLGCEDVASLIVLDTCVVGRLCVVQVVRLFKDFDFDFD